MFQLELLQYPKIYRRASQQRKREGWRLLSQCLGLPRKSYQSPHKAAATASRTMMIAITGAISPYLSA